MGSGVSVPSPTTQCEPSTAFSIQFSGSANASWDGQWVGLVSRPSGNAGYIQPVPEAEAATFFMDPNQVLYSADLATMDYVASQPGLGLDCLLFEPSNTVLPPFYNTADLKISSANTLQSLTKSAPTDPDFVILRDFDCIAEMDGPDIGVLDPMLFTNITLNVVNTGTCPGNICKQLPAGQGPVPYPDTPADFLNFSDFSDAATNAGTPVGYQKTFTNLKAANNANGYLGYSTFSTYDVVGCSQKCNSIVGCQAFNIYYERDPKVEPGSGDNCSNPPSTTTIKCSFWGGPVTQQNAVNAGQWRKNFQIAIAGSNGMFGTTRPLFSSLSFLVSTSGCARHITSIPNPCKSYITPTNVTVQVMSTTLSLRFQVTTQQPTMVTASSSLQRPTALLQIPLSPGSSTTMVHPFPLPGAQQRATPTLLRPASMLLTQETTASPFCATTSIPSSSIRAIKPWDRCVICTVKHLNRAGLQQQSRLIQLVILIAILLVMALQDRARPVVAVLITKLD